MPYAYLSELFLFDIKNIYVCKLVWHKHRHENQGTIFSGIDSPSTMWVLGIGLRLWGKCLYQVEPFSGPNLMTL